MKKVFVVYEGDFSDCDLISVPDCLFSDIHQYAQDFCDWLGSTEDPEYFITVNGRKVLCCETAGFVRWLNRFVSISGEQCAIINEHIVCSKMEGGEVVEF